MRSRDFKENTYKQNTLYILRDKKVIKMQNFNINPQELTLFDSLRSRDFKENTYKQNTLYILRTKKSDKNAKIQH